MAELLIKAVEPWNNNISTVSMDKTDLAIHNSRYRKGDVIVVKPDGWNWGKAEGPPGFIVVKVPEISYEDAKKYEDKLYDGSTPEQLLKAAKHNIETTEVDSIKTLSNSITTVAKSVFDTKIKTKDK